MSKRGQDILLLANVAEEGENPTFEPVGGQRGMTLSENNDTFETTNKLSPGRTREYEMSFYGWSTSLDGVHVAGQAGYEALKRSVRQGTPVLVQIKDGNTIEQGWALVTSRELEAPYDGESTYTMELQGTGTLGPVESGAAGIAQAIEELTNGENGSKKADEPVKIEDENEEN